MWNQAKGSPFGNKSALKLYNSQTLNQWMKNKASNFILDDKANENLIPKGGEQKCTDRYKAGFQDIVQKHFI